MAVGAADLGLDVLETKPPTPRAESENALTWLGLETERGPDVDAIYQVIEGLMTAGGHARRTRLEYCGVAYPVLLENGEVAWARRGCRDRFCPDCGERLSSRLRKAVARKAAGRQVLAVALTRPKRSTETPGQALDAAAADFGRLAASPLLRSRGKTSPPPALPGGVRMLECTARAAGQRIGAHVVRESGIHAHLHLLAELAHGRDLDTVRDQLLEAWAEASKGSEGAAQHIVMVRPADIERAVAYATNFGALASLVGIAPQYARAVAAAMHKRVLVKAWGTWRSVLKPVKTGARFGDRSIASLVQSPHGQIRFGDHVWDANDVYRRLLERPRMMGEEC